MFFLLLIGTLAICGCLFWKKVLPRIPTNEETIPGSNFSNANALSEHRAADDTSALDSQSPSSEDINDDERILLEYPWSSYNNLPLAMQQSMETVILMRLLSKLGDVSYDSCSKSLRDHEDIRTLLLEGWERGTSEALRNSSTFVSLSNVIQEDKNSAPCQELGNLAVTGTDTTRRGDDENYETGGKDSEGEGVHPGEDAFANGVAQGAKNVNVYGGEFVNTSGGDVYNIAGDLWRIVYSSDDFRKIAEWYSSIDHRATHNEIAKKRSKSTGGWFLRSKTYHEWYTCPRNRILWCPGIPGVGKTVMASLVIDHLRTLDESQTFVGIIYFSYKLRSDQSKVAILEALCRQVFEASERSTFKGLHTLHTKRRSRPTKAELRSVLFEAFQDYQHCYLVLDALDEYTTHYSDKEVRDIIGDILSLGEDVKLLVTSRVLGEMEVIFRELGASREHIVADGDDMRRYLTERVTSLKSRLDFDVSEEFSRHIIGKVIEAAKGRFLVAELSINLLSEQLNLGDLEDALGNLPNEIDETYIRVMELIRHYPSSRRELAMKSLMWVAYAYRGLSIRELQHALATKHGREETKKYITPLSTITSLCAGLIVVQDKKPGRSDGERIVLLVHFTTQEFFGKFQSKYFENASKEMFSTCVEYLSIMGNHILPKQFSWSEFSLYADRRVEIPFYDYAAWNWGRHANNHAMSLLEEVLQFLLKNDQPVRITCDFILREGLIGGDEMMGDNGSAVFLAAYHDQVDVLGVLLDRMDDIPRTRKQRTPLHIATISGRTNATKRMLQWLRSSAGGDNSTRNNIQPPGARRQPSAQAVPLVNLRDVYGRTPLTYATLYSHEPIVQLLLEDGDVEVDSGDNGGRAPFQYAIQYAQESIVKLLLDHGAVDLNLKDVHGRTPIWYAIESTREQVIQLLLERGEFQVDSKDDSGQTPFLCAVRGGQVPVIRLLLEHGAMGSGTKDNDGWTAFWYAVREGRASIVKLLLEHEGVDVNLKNHKGQTPLSYAAQFGYEPIAKLLLAYPGVQVDLRDNLGLTPCWYAIRNGHGCIIRLLLEHGGVDVNLQGHTGRSPISYAVWFGHDLIANRLLEHEGIEVDVRDNTGRTPLIYAARRGQHSVVRILLNHRDVEASSKDKYGRTAFSYAVENGHVSIVKLLLEHKSIGVDVKDNYGRTPFSYAARWGHDSVVKLLIEHEGVEVDSKDNKGRTPFSYAAQHGRESTVRYLLDHGEVKVDLEDNFGRTPMAYAAGNGQYSIVKLLLERRDIGIDGGLVFKDSEISLRYAKEHLEQSFFRERAQRVVDLLEAY